MEIVSARSGDQAHVSASVTAIPSVIRTCLNLELLDTVGTWDRNAATACCTALHVAYAYSIQQKIIVIGARSVNVHPIVGFGYLRQSCPTQAKLSSVVHPSRNAGREVRDLDEVPRNPAANRRRRFRLPPDLCRRVLLNH